MQERGRQEVHRPGAGTVSEILLLLSRAGAPACSLHAI